MFYQGLEAGNIQQLAHMAGLCNICTYPGAENFDRLNALLERIHLHWTENNEEESPIPSLHNRAKSFKGYIQGTACNGVSLMNAHVDMTTIQTCQSCNERWW